MNPLTLAVIVSWITVDTSAFTVASSCCRGMSRSSCPSSPTTRFSSEFPWETPLDMAEEETLLKMHLTVRDNVDPDMALAKVQQYTQSFPFAAILPVQPLQYLPTHEGGVDVLFLRKKTQDKGSVDGGMRFFVGPTKEDGDPQGIEVQVKRNSKGQTVSKMFTEKLVVQAYCNGIVGRDEARTGKAPADLVSVVSVFHKWM
jgi:hypothetical protein